MKKRLLQFKKDLSALTEEDAKAAADFNRWLYDYGTYVLIGGTKPKPKPTRPLR